MLPAASLASWPCCRMDYRPRFALHSPTNLIHISVRVDAKLKQYQFNYSVLLSYPLLVFEGITSRRPRILYILFTTTEGGNTWSDSLVVPVVELRIGLLSFNHHTNADLLSSTNPLAQRIHAASLLVNARSSRLNTQTKPTKTTKPSMSISAGSSLGLVE